MSTYEKAFETFTSEMKAMGFHYHEELYHAITKYLGPSIHSKDASLVACSDPGELKHIRESFLIEKLGLNDGPELDEAIQSVCAALGTANKHKHRATFYYLLTALFLKGDLFSEQLKQDAGKN